MAQIRRCLLLQVKIAPKFYLEAVVDRYKTAVRHLKVASTARQSMSMQYFQHPRVPDLQLVRQSVHISLVKTNGVDLSADEKLNLRRSDSRRPPLHHPLRGAKRDDGVAAILSHGTVVIPSVVIGNNLSSGCIVVPQPAVVMKRE